MNDLKINIGKLSCKLFYFLSIKRQFWGWIQHSKAHLYKILKDEYQHSFKSDIWFIFSLWMFYRTVEW